MMIQSPPWSPKMTDHLLRLDAMAAGDTTITFKVMADRLNEAFGTNFERNAIAGKLQRLKAGTGYTRPPRKPGEKAAQASQPQPQAARSKPQPQQRPIKRTLIPPALRKLDRQPAPKPQSAPARPQPWLPPHEPVQSRHVTLLERDASQCCWPVNNGGPFLFCGAPKRRPRNADDERYLGYCEAHFAKLLAKPRQRWSARS